MKKYIALWKDANGNRVIFPASNTLFATREEAEKKAEMDNVVVFLFLGLTSEEVIEVEVDEKDDAMEMRHYPLKTPLGFGALIGGPIYESKEAQAKRELN